MGGISPAGIPTVPRQGNRQAIQPGSKDPSIVVFDEAHNIDNVCIEAFSINLNLITLEKARQNITKLEKEVQK